MSSSSRCHTIFAFPALFQLEKLSIVCLLLLSFSLTTYAQVLPSPPTVYVSAGTTIYMVTVASGTVTPIFTSPNPNANFESLAIGPDNAFTDTDAVCGMDCGNASHPYLLYACDTSAANSIIRFDPTAFDGVHPIKAQTVASGLAFPPICGRSTATSDVYVTNKSGPGVYRLTASSTQTCTLTGQPLQTVPIGCFPFVPDPVGTIGASANSIDTFAGMKGRGLAQKYIGDLLVVDNAGNQVLHSAYGTGALPLFATLSQLITNNLNSPVGVVNAPSLKQIFVSNSNSTASKQMPAQPAVSIFDAGGTPSTTTCPSGLSIGNSNQVPGFLATAPTDQFSGTIPNTTNTRITDTIYLVTSGNSSGTLWTWNTVQGNCILNSVATARAPLSGVAVPPTHVTLTLTQSASVPTNYLFNSSLLQLTTAQNCNATVTAYPFSLATVNSMIALEPSSVQTPSVDLGEGGFERIYKSYNPQCGAVFPNDSVVMLFSNFVDPRQSTNPRYLDCHNSNNPAVTEPQLQGGAQTGCVVATTLGSYPLGGPLSGDYTTKQTNFFAMVNETAGPGTPVPGQFCGFQSPLSGDGITLPSPIPQLTGTADNVKFKVADLSMGGNCQSGPYLSDTTTPLPTALLSVAQICNTTPSNDPFCGPGGSPVFNAINVNNNASSSMPAIFTAKNNQFKFSLQVTGYALGTYSLTVTSLTDNFTIKTTLFRICPSTGCS
jgi:hypothetical protein